MIQRYTQFKAVISRIDKSIQKIERQEMECFGLKGPHVQCLMAISSQEEEMTAAQLCRICDKDKASISRSLAELEEKGLIHREAGYRGSLMLTEQGQAVTARITQTAARAVEAVSLNFDEAQRIAFYQALERIACNLQSICEEGVNDK